MAEERPPAVLTQQGPMMPSPSYDVQQSYSLAADMDAIGNSPVLEDVWGASYVWSVSGTFGGTTATLQALGPDGTTWLNVDSMTANGSKGVVIGHKASLRLNLAGGSPANIHSSLS